MYVVFTYTNGEIIEKKIMNDMVRNLVYWKFVPNPLTRLLFLSYIPNVPEGFTFYQKVKAAR